MAGTFEASTINVISPNGLVTKAITVDNSGIMSIPQNSSSAGTIINYIWSGTQAQYDAIGTKDANTLYFIV